MMNGLEVLWGGGLVGEGIVPAVLWTVAQASVLILLAGGAAIVLRRFPAAARHAVWTVALV
ncbi:MAG: hypothetical protein HKO53_14530, partial [Gemmatimonadetes bacterium]|nr:hypothetical protein [Gemmatimonadota bacterium]